MRGPPSPAALAKRLGGVANGRWVLGAVMVAATHCFEKSLMMTVIQDNINPIEKLERSSLIVASTIHGAPAEALVCDAQRERVATYSAMLFDAEPEPEPEPEPSGP